MAKKSDKKTLRVIGPGHDIFPEGTVPFIVVNQFQLYCHNEILVEDEEGEAVAIKMRPTSKFLTAFNNHVHDLLLDAVQTARDDGRTELMASDVPSTDEDEQE